jgi:large subunit ribosomal protein L32
MAVPKRKTPKAKQRSRRSHHHLQTPQLVRDRSTGRWRINHRAGIERDSKGRPVEEL